jgi:redox-sensitive bicupin YhaK (pirin superfamily)
MLHRVVSGCIRTQALQRSPWIMEGNVGYEDTLGHTGKIYQGGLEWMHAGGGAWHSGDFGDAPRVRGFQLWHALPPEEELGQAESIYLEPDAMEHAGPATLLLGRYGEAKSAIQTPYPINYLSVKLSAGERWRYQPPEGQTVGWIAVSIGRLLAPSGVRAGNPLADFGITPKPDEPEPNR